jgi:hypothetical protein
MARLSKVTLLQIFCLIAGLILQTIEKELYWGQVKNWAVWGA